MKLLSKILKITSILILSILILLFIASLILQERVADFTLKTLNDNFLTKFETESYRFSLIRKFPKASMEMKNVIVYSSHGVDRSGFNGIYSDTLLAAKSVSIDFKTIDLLKGDYTFSRINIRSGNLNLFTDTAGLNNYEISSKKSDGAEENDFSLNLNRINLSDVRVVYNDLNAGLVIKGNFRNSRIKSKITEKKIDFDGNANVIFELFQLHGFALKERITADLEVGLTRNEKGIFFKKSTMSIENWSIILTGFIADDNYLDLNVSGKNIDISQITDFLPERYRSRVSEYNPSGILKIDAKIKGISSRTTDPHYEIIYSLKNARIDNAGSDIRIDRFSFDGYFSNGSQNRPATSSFTISNFHTKLGSAEYRGEFSVSDFSKPLAELTLKGVLYPGELKQFLNLKNVDRAVGSVGLNIKLSGYMEKKERYRFSDILSLDSQSEIIFNSFGIRLNNKLIDLKDANGKFLINENTSTNNFQLVFNDQKIKFDAKLLNLPEWLAGKPVTLTGSGSIYAPCIKPYLFLSKSDEQNEIEVKTAPASLPEDLNLDIDFKFDTLVYKTFRAEKVEGIINCKSKLLNIKTINLNSQKGSIAGNGLIVQNPNKSFVSRGSFSLDNIDINETFTTFNNFGQDFLKAENIAGTLSGSISLLMPLDSLWNPVVKSVVAEGKYVLVNGELKNFEPVKALSSFVQLSELENIKFNQLENDFFIRNNFLHIPQMDVRSSAADLAVNGKHSFDNYYEYHVKIRLSEILSNKARKNKNLNSEFGLVEDDGLGRTSLFLKIESKEDDVRVTYDIKAAGSQIKDEIKKERETLKTIFNQEYGSARYDPDLVEKSTGKPHFRIKWEGTDTTKTESEMPVARKRNILRNIFRKK